MWEEQDPRLRVVLIRWLACLSGELFVMAWLNPVDVNYVQNSHSNTTKCCLLQRLCFSQNGVVFYEWQDIKDHTKYFLFSLEHFLVLNDLNCRHVSFAWSFWEKKVVEHEEKWRKLPVLPYLLSMVLFVFWTDQYTSVWTVVLNSVWCSYDNDYR